MCSSEEKLSVNAKVQTQIVDEKRHLVYNMCICDSSRVTNRRISHLEKEVEKLQKMVMCIQQVLQTDLSCIRDLEEEVIRFKKTREEYEGEVEEIAEKLDEWENFECDTLPKIMLTAVEKTLNVLFDREHRVTIQTLMDRMSTNQEFRAIVKKTTNETLQDWKKEVVGRVMKMAEDEFLKAFDELNL